MKISLTICFILILTYIGFSQSFYPFPKDSAVWINARVWYNPLTTPPTPTLCESVYYFLYGDTIIQNNSYRKLYGNPPFNDSLFDIDSSHYYGAFMQDSMHKVWMRLPNTDDDVLFLDFGLNVGDTFNSRHGPMPVVQIDSILVDGSYRRLIKLIFQGDTIETIDGIGYRSGFWGPNLFSDNISQLKCFKQSKSIIYSIPEPEYCSCNNCFCQSVGVSVEEKMVNKTEIRVYPNPSKDGQFTVEWGDMKVLEIRIFNSSGQTLLSEFVSNQNQLKQLEIKGTKGVYLMSLRTKDSVFNRKLLIQ